MENIGTVKEMIRQDCFMASIDLTDAYHSVPIAKVHQKYLKISWKGQLYQYCSLAFGLSSAPRIFTKLLKPVLAKLRGDGFQSVAYLDDLYLQGKSRIECLKNVEATYDLLQKVGFHINEKKSVLVPTQQIEYLGFSLDSANLTVTLPREKRNSVVEACTELLQSPKRPIRVVARTIGVLVATFPAVPFGPLHYRCSEKEKTQALKESKGNYSRLMTVREGRSLEQLKWWIDNVPRA